MEFNTILDGILKIADKQIAEIKQQTDSRIKDIETSYKKEAEKIRADLEREGKVRLNRESALIKQQAEMQYLQNVANARQELIQKTLDETKSRLENVRDSKKEYKFLLKMFIDEAIQEIKSSLGDDKTIFLFFDPKDKELVKDYKGDTSYALQFEFELDCWGGCNASSVDGKVHVYNTLNDRFQRAKPFLQQRLSLFFDEKTAQDT